MRRAPRDLHRVARGVHDRVWEFEGDGDTFDVVLKAIVTHWGVGAFWWRDQGLASIGNYGQVCRATSGGGSTCLTSRLRLDVENN